MNKLTVTNLKNKFESEVIVMDYNKENNENKVENNVNDNTETFGSFGAFGQSLECVPNSFCYGFYGVGDEVLGGYACGYIPREVYERDRLMNFYKNLPRMSLIICIALILSHLFA